jgi:hypothetical protein
VTRAEWRQCRRRPAGAGVRAGALRLCLEAALGAAGRSSAVCCSTLTIAKLILPRCNRAHTAHGFTWPIPPSRIRDRVVRAPTCCWKIGRRVGRALGGGYQLASVAGRVADGGGDLRFHCSCARVLRMRRTAWLLVVTCSGLGWLMLPLSGGSWFSGEPLDLYSPEGFSSLTLIYMLPHLALARTACWAACWRWRRRLSVERAACAAGRGCGWARRWSYPLRGRRRAVTGAHSAAPARGGDLALARVDWRSWPAFGRRCSRCTSGGFSRAMRCSAVWSAQNNIYCPHCPTTSPPMGCSRRWRCLRCRGPRRSERRLAARLGAGRSLLVYLPVNFQRRLLEGFRWP